MQARLEIKRFPSTLLLIVLALAAALLLGGALAYTFKPVSVTSGPAPVLVLHSSQGGNSNADTGCIIVNKHKAC